MSYSDTNDLVSRIVLKSPTAPGSKSGRDAIESFDNRYFDIIKEKKERIIEKKTTEEQERVKQRSMALGPTSGFFTCKAAKNSALFESKLYELRCHPNADVRPLDKIVEHTLGQSDARRDPHHPIYSPVDLERRQSHFKLYAKSPLLRYTTQRKGIPAFLPLQAAPSSTFDKNTSQPLSHLSRSVIDHRTS